MASDGLRLQQVRVQLRGPREERAPSGGEPGVPVPEGGLQGREPAGRPDLVDQRGDLLQEVAAPPELVDQPGIPYVGLAVHAVSGQRVAARADQPGVLPLAQGGGPDGEPVGQGADEGGGGARAGRGLRRVGPQVAQGALHRPQGPPVVQELGVALVDEEERLVGRAPVHGPHDARRRRVAVAGHQGEERVQGAGVPRGVGAVAAPGALGGREDAGLLVVPYGLRGETVWAGQVDRPQPYPALRVLPHTNPHFRCCQRTRREKFPPKVQRYR